MEENRPWGQRVFLSIKQSLMSSPMMFWCGGVIELHSFTKRQWKRKCELLSPGNLTVLVSDCKLHPVLREDQQGRSRSSSQCRKPAAPRFWWRSCWGKVPAFHEVVLSTIQTHLISKHHKISVHLQADDTTASVKWWAYKCCLPSLTMSIMSSALKLSSSVSWAS